MNSPIQVIDKLQQLLYINQVLEDQEKDDYVDVPYVDDDEYRTNRPYGEQEELKEQEEEEDEEEEEEDTEAPPPLEDEPDEDIPSPEAVTPGEPEDIEPAGEPGEGAPEEIEAGEVGDVGPAAAGVPEAGVGDEFGAGADMGIPGAPEPLKPSEIGKVYELKKIYSRMTSIEKFLADEPDEEMIQLRGYVSSAIDLFKTLSANFQQYKDRLDDIIVTYYKFLEAAYSTLRKYYKKNRGKDA